MLAIGGAVFVAYQTRCYPADDYMKIILHKIGYAIGLKHPHEGDPTLAWHIDDGDHTVMTYNDYEDRLGSLDGVAARHLYGSAGSEQGHL